MAKVGHFMDPPDPGKTRGDGAENLKFLLKFRLQPLRDGVVCLPSQKGARQKRARDFKLAQFCPGRSGGGKNPPRFPGDKIEPFFGPEWASKGDLDL